LLYIDGTVLKVDEVAVCERARLDFERANYFNDNFIIEQLKNVKAKEIKVSYIAPVTAKEDIKKEKIKGKPLCQAIENLLAEEVPLIELYQLAMKEIKSKDLKNEQLQEFYEEFNQNKIYKEMMKNTRDCLLPYQNNSLLSPISLFIEILSIYGEDMKKKERDQEVANIKRIKILNKLLPLGSKAEQIRLTGDYVYIAVRKNFDCYADGNNKVSKRAYDCAINDLMDFRGLKVLDDKHFANKEGKKIKSKDIREEVKQCIESIYNLSENNYIYGLR